MPSIKRQVVFHDVDKMLREQGIRCHLLAVGQCRSIVPCIEDEVGLFKRQLIGVGGGPLLQDLVTDAPYQDRRMVTVAPHHVGEVALMPLIEEAGIVVLRLPSAPHVETLVHDDEAHRVAHIEQLRSGRIMTATDGVDTHLLQFEELPVQSVFIECSPETTEVMMVTDTIQLHVLAIEPEAGLGIETIVTEARRRRHLVNSLVVHNDLTLDGVNIRRRRRPQVRLFHLELLLR